MSIQQLARIGVDSHADTLAICGIDPVGVEVFHYEIPNTFEAIDSIIERVKDREVVWGIEGTGTFGRALCDRLLAGERHVVEVPTRLTGRYRSKAGHHKTDRGDAAAIARASLMDPCAVVTHGQVTESLRLLTLQRHRLVETRTQITNRIKARLRELDPSIALPRSRSKKRYKELTVAPPGPHSHPNGDDLWLVISIDATNWLTLDTQIRRLETRIDEVLPESGRALMTIAGIGLIGAGTILANTGDITRFETDGHYAMMCGTAPLDASSGRQQHHRLNSYGNRTLNTVIHTAIVSQIRHKGEAFDYINRRVADGKTKRDAIRAVKRKLTRRIYRILTHHHTKEQQN